MWRTTMRLCDGIPILPGIKREKLFTYRTFLRYDASESTHPRCGASVATVTPRPRYWSLIACPSHRYPPDLPAMAMPFPATVETYAPRAGRLRRRP